MLFLHTTPLPVDIANLATRTRKRDAIPHPLAATAILLPPSTNKTPLPSTLQGKHLDSKYLDAIMRTMRTTVTLDPDVEAKLRALMRERGISFKEALNSAVRAGLASTRTPTRRYKLKTYHMGLRPGIQLTKALAGAAELEDEEIVRKLELRK